MKPTRKCIYARSVGLEEGAHHLGPPAGRRAYQHPLLIPTKTSLLATHSGCGNRFPSMTGNHIRSTIRGRKSFFPFAMVAVLRSSVRRLSIVAYHRFLISCSVKSTPSFRMTRSQRSFHMRWVASEHRIVHRASDSVLRDPPSVLKTAHPAPRKPQPGWCHGKAVCPHRSFRSCQISPSVKGQIYYRITCITYNL